MDVLPLSVHYLIIEKLNPIARIRLGSISRLWRQITKQFEDEAKPQRFPWVMLHPLDSPTPEFLSIEDGYATLKLKFLDHFTASGRKLWWYNFVSSNKKGWMVWEILTRVEQDLYPYHPVGHLWLINPLSCFAIELPFSKIQVAPGLPEAPFRVHFSIRKVVFSSDPLATDCVVAAIDNNGKTYFSRLGEPTWTCWGDPILDMVFYEGRFLGFDPIFERFMVFEYNHFGRHVDARVYQAPVPWEPALHLLAPSQWEYVCSDFVYMLESCGEVLLVLRLSPDRRLHEINYDCQHAPPRFYVFKLDSIKYKWVWMDSLGDTILFVGDSNSTSISAKNFPAMNLKGNCIYFTTRRYPEGCERCINYGVYYLEDGRIEPFFPSETHPPNAKSPLLWFAPKPLEIK